MPGRHSATQPMPGRRRAHSRPGGRRRAVAVLGAAALAAGLLVAVAAGTWLRGGNGCEGPDALTLAAAPEVAPAVEDVVAGLDASELGAADACVLVAPTEPDDALAALDAGAQAPDLWIPDTSAWLSQLPQSLSQRRTWSLATSPVVLAGPADAPGPATWLDGLSAPGAVLLDPRESGASIGALAALRAEALSGDTSGTALSRRLVSEAQAAPDETLSDDDLLAAGEDRSARWFPTTEQRFLARAGPARVSGLSITVPRSGTTLLDYPLVPLASGADASRAAAVAEALVQRLRSPSGARRLAEAGFRPPSGAPTDAAAGMGPVEEVGRVPPDAIVDLLDTWTAMNADARMLAVLDVSGSMYAREGARTRIALARDAMLAALRSMPDTWDLGLWAFSVGLGADTDHRVLAPLRTLAAVAGEASHREVLAAEVERLPRLVGGGTGLYDTTLAAYRAVASGYLSDRFNSVVLLTDGRNEDADGLSLPGLLGALRRERDPSRPVPVVTVAMGPQADTAALDRIAGATGGATFVARDPEDIERILADALLERAGWSLG
ncbi:MAG: substrate-binding and VWA domain-containing protein [Actinomycetota bacterium]|nr:substrate-binding and VWA domain-containing protein [Actinomycetota bacterium]